MHWLKQGKTRHLCRTVRVGNKFKREYLGCGPKAELTFASYQLRREADRERQARVQQAQNEAREVQATIKDFASWTELLTRTTLLLAGYHQHQRGPWRKRSDQIRTEPHSSLNYPPVNISNSWSGWPTAATRRPSIASVRRLMSFLKFWKMARYLAPNAQASLTALGNRPPPSRLSPVKSSRSPVRFPAPDHRYAALVPRPPARQHHPAVNRFGTRVRVSAQAALGGRWASPVIVKCAAHRRCPSTGLILFVRKESGTRDQPR